MFIAALFTIAKTCKQPKCPSTEEWIKKMWFIYIAEYYSAIKKSELMPFAATWMDLESVLLSEVSQRKETPTHPRAPAPQREATAMRSVSTTTRE